MPPPAAAAAPPMQGPPPPRAVTCRPVVPTHLPDGMPIPTNAWLAKQRNQKMKPKDPPPPHMVLDWSVMGPEKISDPNSLEVDLDELPTDITSYMDVMKAHGVSEVLKASLEAVVKMSPRPKDPVAALGRLISE